MSKTNEMIQMIWHETCSCKCIDVSVCNDKQRWNSNKCRCECKEFVVKDRCDNGSIWNLSTCEFECDKTCDIGEYLDYANCKYTKRLINRIVKKWRYEDIKILMEVKWFIMGFCMIMEEYASLVYYA